jgi:heterodisulfide reductase subunit A
VIELTINGQKGKFSEGKTLLECIQEMGLKVPTLCYHKALSPYGACRLCLVEITQGTRTTIQTSCTYPALDGLVVETHSERVVKNRKIIIELLLARCPDSDEIKKLAKELGVEKTRIKPKNEDCVLCGLCVRMCEERMGRGAISFAGRGSERKVVSPFGDPTEVCQTCGACDFICPTGKIGVPEYSKNKPIPIASEYNRGLVSRSAVYIPYPQAIPNKAVIDPRYCVHLLRGECKVCQEFCEAEAINYEQKEEKEVIDVGALILSPGYDHFDPAEKTEYSYLKSPNIVTALEFERILSATGPYEGHLFRPSDLTPPKKIAFVQCVGSRDEKHDYCSSICCMYATKEAIIAKEHSHDSLECHIYYMDVRAFGKGFDQYYDRAKELGIHYIPSRPSAVEPVKETGNVLVEYVSDDGHVNHQEYDMVILSTGVIPTESAKEIQDVFDVRFNKHGFCRTMDFGPIDSSKEGVFVCGPFTEPKDIPETVMEASSAASRAMVYLAEARGTEITEVELPPEKNVAGEPPRIGVFICHCGINIGGYLDVPSIAEYAKTLPYVVYTDDNLYTCSSDTQQIMKEKIEEYNLNRVVVASCTPRTHEPLFQQTIREAGLNPHLFEMANIRDQCSWVHMRETEAATYKATDLVRMAVTKVALTVPLKSIPLEVTHKALVVGGGIAGMTSAISLADQGFEVFLVEKTDKLGGNALKIDQDLYGNDVKKQVEKMTQRVMNHALIRVFMNSQLSKVDGFVGNFVSTIETRNGNGVESAEVEHGVAIVATGGSENTPDEYLYGKSEKILTLLELSEAIQAEDFTVPETVVMIQCVGSREPGHNYCSRVCCTGAIKNAIRMKKKNPDATIIILYRDIRTYGFREQYYSQAREMGIEFIRYEVDNKPVVEQDGDHITVKTYDPILGAALNIPADLLVLSSRINPNPDNEELSQFFKVPLTNEKFFLEAHVKLRPVDFATDGIYLCGLAHYPKDINEAISQAMAASGRAATVLSKDLIAGESKISYVNELRCSGCGACVTVCAYNAISLDEERQVAVINELLCKGCGACAATCRGSAIRLRGFEDQQILKMLSVM